VASAVLRIPAMAADSFSAIPAGNPGYGQFCALLHTPDATAKQSRSFNDLLRETTSPANTVALLNAYLRTNVQDVVPEVRCPTLVLHSRGDSIIPFDQGRSVAALNSSLSPLKSSASRILSRP
jgi:pimeloyl-ACP methyl ester carboxylesterase